MDAPTPLWEMTFPIAGWQHYDGEPLLPSLKAGDPLVLRPELDNPYDTNAVAVYTEGGKKLG